MSWREDHCYVGPEHVPSWACAFVYRITRLSDGALYIGKKSLTSTRRKVVGKRALKKAMDEAVDKRRVKKVEKVVKDSGWMNYNSSNKELAELIKANPEQFDKQIICWCHSKKYATYMEIKHIIIEDALSKEGWNGNLGGTIYRKDIVNPHI